MHEDTYFLNSQEALRVASEQNRWGEEVKYNLQCCYYDGEKIDSDLPNLIHLPIENLLEELAYGKYRIPKVLNFEGLELSSDVKLDILVNFNLSIKQANMYRLQLNKVYLNSIKNASPDFSEPLRFYLSASSSTQVMQYVSKNIADTLKAMNYDVSFELYVGIEDIGCLKNISEFNPHVTININHLNNSFLNDSIFNFVWFQDPMPALYDNTKLNLRDRDIIFTLSDMMMEKKFTKDMYKIQRFCVNSSDFNRDESIEKEDKIIFVGSSHAAVLIKEISDPAIIDLYYLLKYKLNDGFKITKEYLLGLSQTYNVAFDTILITPFAMAVRECSVEWMCKQNKIDVEVYGRHWEDNPIVAPYFKGELPHGKEVAKRYNSAKYSLYAHSFDMYQQRLPEMAACGTIPVSYNCIGIVEDSYDYEDNTLLFSNYDEFVDMIGKKPKKSVYEISRDMSFDSLANKIVEIIKQKVD